MQNQIDIPKGACILQAGGKGGSGNVLLLFDRMDPPRVLKVYRTRRSQFRERLRTFAQVALEGKTGSRPSDRYAAEKENLLAWQQAGCDVIRIFDEPAPEEITDPALWLEYLPRPNLQDVLRDPETAPAHRDQLLQQVGREVCRRQQSAEATGDVRLIHEHATLNHFFVDGDRLVAFDLENGYRKNFPVMEALSQELSTLLRSVSRLNAERSEQDLRSFLDGYENRELLQRILHHGLNAPGLRRTLKRWYDRKTRPGKSKTDVLEVVQGMM